MPASTLFDRATRVRLVRAARDSAGNPVVNGIDRIDVVPETGLLVHFIHPLPDGAPLRPDQVRIEGGERIRVLAVSADRTKLSVTVDRRGDFSTYRLVVDAPDAGLDPPLSRIDFSFRADCASDFDCRQADAPAGEVLPEPRIDYLAKDFASFRQLVFDRLAVLVPGWTERNPADFGVALVELFAYVGDYLSYQQDAIATEAYLGTARHRVSARRHAQLVDYQMHDGCNARAWVHVAVAAGGTTVRQGTQFWTSVAGQQPLVSDSLERDRAVSAGATFFEALADTPLAPERNRIELHPWGVDDAVLPAGSTSATLRDPGEKLGLDPGDILLLEEVPGRRHPVRLTAVTKSQDALGDGGTVRPLPLLEVQWAAEDAVPFAVALKQAVACGNLVPVDHGRTISTGEQLPRAPARPRRYRPPLSQAPVTQATSLEPAPPSAAAALRHDVQAAVPALSLRDGAGRQWAARRTLIDSGPNSTEFVLEVENDGTAVLRFGDGEFGRQPDPGTELTAFYRVGNGSAGNVGADAIRHLFLPGGPEVLAVRNPLPAAGGTDPESIDEVRVHAPVTFRRRQRRAVTAADYARFVTERDDVQAAAAVTRWTGSSRTVFITVDRVGGAEVDAAFALQLREWLEPVRLAGHDIEIDRPRLVPLEIAMRVRVAPDFFRADVRRALELLFSSRLLPDGRRGEFHPDNLTFGEPVFLSRLIATAQGVEGVADVVITTFQRQGVADSQGLDAGLLTFGRLEIAQLANNPNFPDRGIVRIDLDGGK